MSDTTPTGVGEFYRCRWGGSDPWACEYELLADRVNFRRWNGGTSEEMVRQLSELREPPDRTSRRYRTERPGRAMLVAVSLVGTVAGLLWPTIRVAGWGTEHQAFIWGMSLMVAFLFTLHSVGSEAVSYGATFQQRGGGDGPSVWCSNEQNATEFEAFVAKVTGAVRQARPKSS